MEAVAKRLISLSKQVEMEEGVCVIKGHLEDVGQEWDQRRRTRAEKTGGSVGGRGERVEVLLTWHEAARGRDAEDGGVIGCGAPQKMKEENRQQPSLDPEPLFINPSVVERWIL